MRRPILLPLALVAVATLALAGCSSQGKQSGDTKSSSSQEEIKPGPLDEYLQAIYGNQEWNEESAKDQDRQREELVAKCMKKEGFEYKPNTGNVSYASDSTGNGPAWGTREFAEQYGFGIVSWPGREDADSQPTENDYVDPNADYLATLSESEQAAFWEALYGPAPTEDELKQQESGEGSQEWTWEKGGCNGWAQHELTKDTGANFWEDPDFKDLVAAMQDMWSDSSSSPESVALNADWSACMTEAGFDGLTSRDQAQQSLYDKQNELYKQGPDGVWNEPSKEDKDAFQKEEIKLAVADFDCAKKVNYTKRTTEIEHLKQQEFLDQHKAELDKALAKYSTADKSGKK